VAALVLVFVAHRLLPGGTARERGREDPMAEENAQAAAAAPEAEAAPKGGKGKLIPIIGGVVVLLGGGAGFAWWKGILSHGAPAEAKEEVNDEKASVGAIVPLDPFIANLADEDGKRYLKATLQVEFYGSKEPEDFKLPQVRDLLLTLFSSKVFAEIRSPDGKAQLREEIINRLNRALHKDLVKTVYFTEFIVQ
jgi:flagellar FliL protein